MLLSELLAGIHADAAKLPQVDCSGLTTDSRLAEGGDLFIALSGSRFDGRRFIKEAAEKGAVAALCEEAAPPDAPLPSVQVPALKRNLAELARRMYEKSVAGLGVIGVTGTNGKTTVAYLLREMFKQDGCGLVGTVEYDLVSSRMKAFLTTPQVVEAWRFLSQVRRSGARFAALEVSSQGLDMGRVEGVPFTAAIFTNLSQDHLDYHKSMEAYLEAKLRLFRMLPEDAVAVVNLDAVAAADVLAATKARRIGVTLRPRRAGWKGVQAVYRGRILQNSLAGIRMRVSLPGGRRSDMSSPLVGRFNAMNLLEAAACARELGVPLEALRRAAGFFGGAPGRLERLRPASNLEPLVLVDYAHTPDALKNALETLRPLGSGRLLVVFGCGGDRDRLKRPMMGSLASRLADVVVITSDNPRSEEPEEIIRQVLGGVDGAAEVQVEPDRRKAIRMALGRAAAGDVVLIAGKGHEDYQEIKGVRYPLDDRAEAIAALRATGFC